MTKWEVARITQQDTPEFEQPAGAQKITGFLDHTGPCDTKDFNMHEHLICPLRSFQFSSPEYCSGGNPSGGEFFQGTAEKTGRAYALLILQACTWGWGAHLALGKF